MFSKAGFVLLELLLAIGLIQVGVLGCSQLLVDSLVVQVNLERSLEALQLLRGEMEKLESIVPPGPTSLPAQELKPGYQFSLEVLRVDEDGDLQPDYQIAIGELVWKKVGAGERSYRLLTYLDS